METFQRHILRHIRSNRPLSEAAFNRFAIQTYLWQRSRNKIYDLFCEAEGIKEVRCWQEIPALPVAAFKHHRVACFERSRTRRIFLTSGTTRGLARGKHEFEDLSFYDAAIRPLFGRYVVPDLKRGERVRFVFLALDPREAPHSSLSYMGGRTAQLFGRGKPFYGLTKNGLRTEALTEYLSACVRKNEKVLIFTTTFALADFLDHLFAEGIALRLPAGSRIMETGGYKGRRKEVGRQDLVLRSAKHLGVPGRRVINEYGMTELSSQFYDRGRASKSGVSIKYGAPWMRVIMADPASGRPLPQRQTGLIRIYDLANQGSCFAIQTEDLGRRVGAGFELIGRSPAAALRGCSLGFEEISKR
ncbi:MAG: hypothetical protein KBD07_03475 [Candidatus Omnitrophica bacterium]|nr:hypothetical protein [Candidatus Omnitrophota bacterium]